MAKVVDTPTSDQTEAVHYSPIYLIDFTSVNANLRVNTSSDLITWNGHNWSAGYAIQWSNGVPTISAPQSNDEVFFGFSSSLFTQARTSGKAIIVYQCYRTGPLATDITNPYIEFTGQITKLSVTESLVSFRTRRVTPAPLPHLKVVPSTNAFNHLPKRGTVIRTQRDKYIIGN